MRPLFGLFFIILVVVSSHATTVPPPPLPVCESMRGKSPAEIAEQTHKYNEALSLWLEQLTPDQRAAWYASIGEQDPAKTRRRGTQMIPTAATGYDWRVVARSARFSEKELAQLERDKVLIEDVSLKQSFEAYTMPRGPVFITSDSALNAFHVLFEDSFRELESRRAFALRDHLENILTKTRELIAGNRNEFSPAELQPGWRHAQYVVGPALRLLGTPSEFFDADTREEIEKQVEKIRASTSIELPSWLAPESPTLLAIDYRRCKPIGFYTVSPSLQNYYRAVRWLQSVPFRVARDNELTAIGLLGYATMKDYRHSPVTFFRSYHDILGRPDDPALPEASYEFQNFLMGGRKKITWQEALSSKRRWLAREHMPHEDWMKLNDADRLPPEASAKLSELQFRVLSAYRLPDSLALAKLTEPGRLPSGLAVAALLGSEFARRQFSSAEVERLNAALAVARDDWHPPEGNRHSHESSLYDRYLDTLASLSAPAEPDAPAFMRNDAWAAKSCQTILASWAQMRHTFTLQAKQSAMYLGLVDVPPGFVEPNPEFFRRLSDLVEQAASDLDQAGVFEESSKVEAERLRMAATELESFGFHLPGSSYKSLQKLTPAQAKRYRAAIRASSDGLSDISVLELETDEHSTETEFQTVHRDWIAGLRSAADDYDSGKRVPDAQRKSLRLRWDKLKSVTRRLEALAHKQLRRQRWTVEEDLFIRGHGEQVALVMGYFGNSWLTPHDDAPRWATVASDPNTDTMLAVATGRARLIRVLYPYEGGEVFCTGSVMSYHEYTSKQLLTDEEWKALLDSPQAPALPAWLSPYLAK